MKGYVITLLNLPESVKMAERCVASGKQFNIDVEIFPAVWRTEAREELTNEGLKPSSFDESWSNPEAVIGNFISQYRIWKTIVSSGEPGIVFEHDAVVVAPIPNMEKHDIVTLGKPSFGNYNTQPKPGIYPLFSKPGGYAPGAHSYYVTPKGAQQLIDVATVKGAGPCDIFLHIKTFPNLKETYPWPVEAHDSFTTIQIEKGCKAKHNYDENYKII